MSEQEQTKSSTEVAQTLQDFSWPVTGANWFLIGVGGTVQTIASGLNPDGSGGEFIGRLIGQLFFAAIPVTVAYLLVPNKKSFRIRRAFTISGWCILLLLFYPVIKRSYAAPNSATVIVSRTDSMSTYADPTTIRRVGGSAEMWELTDYKALQRFQDKNLSVNNI